MKGLFMLLSYFWACSILAQSYFYQDIPVALQVVYPKPDGSFMWAGGTNSLDDLCLYHTDSFGKGLWQGNYGGNDMEFWGGGTTTSDGSYLLCGSSWSYAPPEDSITSPFSYIVRISEEGDLMWETVAFDSIQIDSFSWARNDPYGIIETYSRDIMLVGSSIRNYSTTDSDIYILKLDSLGNKLWDKTYPNYGYEIGRDIIEDKEHKNEFIVVGCLNVDTANFVLRPYIMKINGGGDTLWTKLFDEGKMFWDIEATQNPNEYLVTGSMTLKIRSNGEIVWINKTQEGSKIRELPDSSGYLVSGNYRTIKFAKLNKSGKSVWERDMYQDYEFTIRDFQPLCDGTIVFAGTKTGDNKILHTDCEGNQINPSVFCVCKAPEPPVEPLPFEVIVFPTVLFSGESFTVKIDSKPQEAKMSLKIYDMIGREVVIIDNLAEGKNEFVIPHISNALYMYQVYYNSNIIKTGKIILGAY